VKVYDVDNDDDDDDEKDGEAKEVGIYCVGHFTNFGITNKLDAFSFFRSIWRILIDCLNYLMQN